MAFARPVLPVHSAKQLGANVCETDGKKKEESRGREEGACLKDENGRERAPLKSSELAGLITEDEAVCSCITAENRQDAAEGVEETPVRRTITDLT